MSGRELIDDIVKSFEKEFSDVNCGTLENSILQEAVGYVSTGILGLDYVIGREGIPLGRLTEIAGFESSSKSTLCAHIVGQFQKAGGVAVVFDTEASYQQDWCNTFGIDLSKLVYIQPQTLQSAFTQIAFVIDKIRESNSDAPVLIVFDSIAATPTEEEHDATDYASTALAIHARVLSRALRKITSKIWDHKVALVLVNQLKERPGITFGKNTAKIGGHAINYHAALQLEVQRTGFLKADDGEVIGMSARVTAVKNKLAAPHRNCVYNLLFGKGIDSKSTWMPLLEKLELVKRAGGWIEFNGTKYREKDLLLKFDDSVEEDLRRRLGLIK